MYSHCLHTFYIRTDDMYLSIMSADPLVLPPLYSACPYNL